MHESDSVSLVPSSRASEATFGTFSPDFRNIMGLVRTIVPKGTGKWLERVTGRDQRTTEFWLQGKYQPRGESQRRIVRALRAEIDQQQKLLKQFEFEI